MPGLNIFTSNLLEILVEQLAHLVKVPVSSGLDPEIVVVQSPGMARWISLELARHNGICANIQFPFPNTFLEEVAKKAIPEFRESSPFDPDFMVFSVMKALLECIRRPGFENLKAYLTRNPSELKRLQLSSKLADLFDQYQVFRPEMIFRWEKNKPVDKVDHPEEAWQAALWRHLYNGSESVNRASLQRDLIKKIITEPDQFKNLPPRIFIFGISYLPSFHMDAFVALSQLVEMNLFLLNPCCEYWGDIVSEKQKQRIARKYPLSADQVAELHLEEGNRLLASMGTHGKEFFTVISNFDFEIFETNRDPQCSDLLSCIQSDILNLRERQVVPDVAEDRGAKPKDLSPGMCIDDSDTSIQIHSCHSEMREVEVLHDALLAMFDEDPHLMPKDIVVMAPDIELYAPYIQAVFAPQPDERLRIPFSIADQSARRHGRLIDGFFSFLDLKGSRFSVTRILQLLEYPGVKEKFSFNQTDIENVERWIRDTRIRWGIDAAHRKEMGLPAISENTWSAGIQRLLLGYAMPGDNQHMFAGLLPYDHVEGSEVHSFGKFLGFLDRVFRYASELDLPKSLRKWGVLFKRMLEDLFLPGEALEAEAQILRRVFSDLGDQQKDSGFDDELEFETIRFYLSQRLDRLGAGSGFMTGGITFCAMLPMRSIPFKIICLLGMNSDVFPRENQPLTFDLIARHPHAGDRSRRNDDKYLFLESIISARNKLYISFVGQNIQDNSRIPPSVVISELMDTIERGFELPGKDILDHVLTVHRLQAFSPQYYTKHSGLFSYSAENLDASTFLHRHQLPAPLIAAPLPFTPGEIEALKSIDIETLSRFFSNPVRFLLQHRLGIYLEEKTTLADKREDFEFNSLEQYLVGQNLVNFGMQEGVLNDFRPAQIAMGQLPHGQVGAFYFNELSNHAEQFVRKIASLKRTEIASARETSLEMGESWIQVRLPEIYERGLIQARFAKQRAQDLIRSWIYHLAFCETAPENVVPTTLIIFKNAAWQLNPVDRHSKTLMDLFHWFKAGLVMPLHLFPASSLEYAQQEIINGQSKATARARARNKWLGSDYTRGESDNPYYDACFKMTDPLDESFEEVSTAVFGPLLENLSAIDISKTDP